MNVAGYDVKSLRFILALPLAASAFGQNNLLDADSNSPSFNNPSFERPDTTFVSIVADKWELTGPKTIVDIPPYGSVPITAGCGIFENPPPDDAQRVGGADGSQIAYIFGNSFTSAEPGDPTVDHAFTQHTQLTLAAGKEYELAIAFANAQAVPGPECVLTMSLFAFDSGNPSAELLLASDTITSAQLNTETLVDFTAVTAPISGDAIGKQIGIRIGTHSPVSGVPGGGQFDFDNVRLSIPQYWDANGPIGGAGTALTGTWGASSNWSGSAHGTSPTHGYNGDLNTPVRFSAGGDAAGDFTVTVSGTQLAGSLHFQEGNVTLAGGQVTLGTGVIDVAAGSSATIGSVITSTTGLHKIGAGTLVLANQLTTSSSISVTGGGAIDLKDNKLIVTAQSGPAVESLVAAGNLMTSMPAATTGLTTLAVAIAGEVGKTTFGGVSVASSDVLVMYTYDGDANLDGEIDGDDYARIDSGFSASLTGYAKGDFNYSGFIDADDYFIIDRNYNRQGTPFTAAPPASVVAVPEPACVELLACAMLMLARRRRRKVIIERCAT